MSTIEHPFARNRAEEMGVDLWDDFVVPPCFDRLAILNTRKPHLLIGGRGCGKTTILRYFSYTTQFSAQRVNIDPQAFNTIGLYLRADTQFLGAFQGGGIKLSQWRTAFEHFLCLTLAEEILGCISQINIDQNRIQRFGKIEALDFSVLQAFDQNLPTNFAELRAAIRRQRYELSAWINNLETAPLPRFYPKEFLTAIISEVARALPYLRNTVFAVFLDEYENLLADQQRLVNTYIKFSQPPLVFHIAMKRNGMRTRETVGEESIQEVGDFRTIDIEEALSSDFDLFAAELFFFRLLQKGANPQKVPVNKSHLQSVEKLTARFNDPAYRASVLGGVERILPSMSAHATSSFVLRDDVLRRKLLDLIKEGLKTKGSPLDAEAFVDDAFPDASVTCGALVYQKLKTPEEVLEEFCLLKDGKSSQFKAGGWIHHFLFGTLFLLFLPLQRPCPLYAGFGTFLGLAKLNVRHFLELCHLSQTRHGHIKSLEELVVDVATQATAAREASALFVSEIKGSGDYGNRLHILAFTLGQLFRLSQQRQSQSEPERTHFSIEHIPSPEEQKLLDEAVKWSVLFQHEETKVKSGSFESFEYVLNPIYAPYFGISYRKGRRLELTSADARVLFNGSHEELTKLIRRYELAWSKDKSKQLSFLQDT